jgi:hypothetical protein
VVVSPSPFREKPNLLSLTLSLLCTSSRNPIDCVQYFHKKKRTEKVLE